MSRVRQRRLQADQARIARAFEGNSRIRIVKAEGAPPDRYQIEYRILGLALQGSRVIKRDRHLAEVYLTTNYPRQAPQCRMLTPCFHPNIDPNAICVGDHWAAGESLANLIVRIGEIIAYQSYNTKSPLNGEAARWCDENRGLLPIDAGEIRPASLSDADATPVRVAPAPKPIPRGRIVKPSGGAPAARAVPAAKPKRVLRAKKVRPSAPPNSSAGGGQLAAVVNCPCGRTYRPKRPKPFRCFGCGTTLNPLA